MKKIIKYLFLFILIFLSFSVTLEFVSADNDKWYRVWGGNGHDECTAIALDSSENIYLGGFFSRPSYYDICFVKYNNVGKYQWNRTFGGGFTNLGGPMVIDSSDNILIAGWIYNNNSGNDDIVLIKYDSSGNYQWNKTWDSGKDDRCYTIVSDSLENIYLAGSLFSGWNNEDFCLVKYDNLGNYLWNRTWGGSNNDICWAIALDSSDNIFLVGDTKSFGAGNFDMCLVSYNSTGDFQWYNTWGGSDCDFCRAIVFDTLENMYLAGSTYDAGFSDFCLVKYNKLGVYQWNRTWGGESFDYCNSMLIDPSENLYLAGTKGDQYSLVVYDTNGNFQWTKSVKIYDGGYVSGMVRDTKGNIYIGGGVHSNTGGYDFLLIKNLHLFTDLQISGYNAFLLTIMIGIFLFVFILKFELIKIKHNHQ